MNSFVYKEVIRTLEKPIIIIDFGHNMATVNNQKEKEVISVRQKQKIFSNNKTKNRQLSLFDVKLSKRASQVQYPVLSITLGLIWTSVEMAI
ncbi:MAG: hypothetical protein UT48_C0006G0012 [Parcubacteria group bacterium GW2011_GWE2_39_37]|uniref:Uncharacterized protein n=1 Tax=Candidatus Falkowbacteria bacterium GW2011_GWF2_39_8 TaxID=1618642 RepID=A0A0G0Q143_9BACT|nr:MAG: hypothetical protein UT48_C0006G0012 [Parcubacteria group bacterium GW2011_GWE2_39_37]KKR33873.1 MAG: hypothetical protein UT64_C0002G0012 [Candidatus Falkowbacteria bacterium GW2011_GWF2_39_8]